MLYSKASLFSANILISPSRCLSDFYSLNKAHYFFLQATTLLLSSGQKRWRFPGAGVRQRSVCGPNREVEGGQLLNFSSLWKNLWKKMCTLLPALARLLMMCQGVEWYQNPSPEGGGRGEGVGGGGREGGGGCGGRLFQVILVPKTKWHVLFSFTDVTNSAWWYSGPQDSDTYCFVCLLTSHALAIHRRMFHGWNVSRGGGKGRDNGLSCGRGSCSVLLPFAIWQSNLAFWDRRTICYHLFNDLVQRCHFDVTFRSLVRHIAHP